MDGRLGLNLRARHQYNFHVDSHWFKISFSRTASDGSLKWEALEGALFINRCTIELRDPERTYKTRGRRTGREEPKCIEISEAPWTSEIRMRLLSRQGKLKAVEPPREPVRWSPHVWRPCVTQHLCERTRAHLSAAYRSPRTLSNVSTVQTKLLPFSNHVNVPLIHVIL